MRGGLERRGTVDEKIDKRLRPMVSDGINRDRMLNAGERIGKRILGRVSGGVALTLVRRHSRWEMRHRRESTDTFYVCDVKVLRCAHEKVTRETGIACAVIRRKHGAIMGQHWSACEDMILICAGRAEYEARVPWHIQLNQQLATVASHISHHWSAFSSSECRSMT